jgi:F0F1-type ATP synthase assembly protein I
MIRTLGSSLVYKDTIVVFLISNQCIAIHTIIGFLIFILHVCTAKTCISFFTVHHRAMQIIPFHFEGPNLRQAPNTCLL